MTLTTPVPTEAVTDTDTEPTLHLNPAVAVIRCSDNEVFLRHGSRSSATHRIEDTNGRGVLADFALAFAEPRTVSAVAAELGIPSEDASEFASHLLDGRALVTEQSVRSGYVLAGLGHDLGRVDTEVSIVGEGRVADAIAGPADSTRTNSAFSSSTSRGWNRATTSTTR
ncbi:hypothetical protein [Microbacterium sp.]|uniref:hypothetical protein n=1 Tax=Microbacterium sp. TaxID=51671 RepID=UPI003A84D8CC